MEDSCDGAARTIHIPSSGPGSAIIVRSHQGTHYKSGVTCHFIVKTNQGYRILVVFDALQFPGNQGNCSDSLMLSNAEDVNGPICSSSTKDVVSKENILNLTWTTGGGTAASVNDGFEAIITAYKPSSRFCTFSEYRCDNHRCVADNLACDGHNNCGDNSDERCDFGSTFWRSYASTLLMVGGLLVVGVCMVCPLILRGCAARDDQPNMQPCLVQRSDGVMPPPGPNVGPTPYLIQDSEEPSQTNQLGSMPLYGVTGIPVNLETGRQMRFPAGPPELANVDYPRSGVNPVVMSVTDASAPSLPDIFSESQPLLAARRNPERQEQPAGFTDLQQPFRAANAQVPQRTRTPMFQHSHPPLSLYDHPDPMRAFRGFGMGGPMGAPMGVPMGGVMGAPIIAGMGGPMGVPLGGPMGGPFQPMPRFPTFIIIETGDDDSDSQDLSLYPPARSLPPSDSSSSNQDTVFPTLLIQQRKQQREQREAEEAARRDSGSGNDRRPHHHRRNRRRGGDTDSAGRIFLADGRDTPPVTKDEKDEDKKPRNAVVTTGTPTGKSAAGALARLHRPAGKKAAEKEKEKEIPEAEKTVMRMEQIETTLSTAAAALGKLGFFGRPISAPSGNDCTGLNSNGVVVRRAKSQWDAPLGRNNEEEKLIYDLPSESTYDYASVWSNSSPTSSESSPTTTETDASKTMTQSTETDSDVNYLRPTVSLENITLLDRAEQRDKCRHVIRKRE
ncbi:uncharacterized protein LOC144142938 [Haemaphysalis longicornis]